MAITKVGCCNYYGNLKGKLYGENIGLFVVDEAYQRILERHEDRLLKLQHKMLAELRSSFSAEIKAFKKESELVAKRIGEIEKTLKKAADEKKEQESAEKK